MAGDRERHVLADTFLSKGENFKRTLLSINDGVYMTDRERRIIFWNRACERITGYSARQVLGRRCSDNILNHVDSYGNRLCESDLCPLYRSMTTGQPGEKPLLVRAMREDGSRAVVEVNVAPLLEEDGSVIGGVEVFRDVTEKQELAEMKARFLSGVTHELKTPLTIIQGFLELVLAGDAGPVTELQRDFLGSAREEVDRFKKILDDLMDISRFEATEFSFNPKAIDLSAALRQAVDGFSGEARRKGIALEAKVPEGITVYGDRARLYQAFSNLISNAVKYTEKGEVAVTAVPDDTCVVVTVQDSGIGIAPGEARKIFELFYRIDNETTRKVGGTGIGLSIVQTIIHRHGGTIDVWSDPGKGSAFTVTLPLLKAG
ncbi:MAG: PAS domain-containing sensor histidine kinase [Firmicutes bacterium]|nr:PAS domain-containing sensor histidine kinase [Bacillota bacterium]